MDNELNELAESLRDARDAIFGVPRARVGVFKPKIMQTLRPYSAPLIGRTFEWECIGTSNADEPYPGQTRWLISRAAHPELEREATVRWVPEEDIEFAEEPKPIN